MALKLSKILSKGSRMAHGQKRARRFCAKCAAANRRKPVTFIPTGACTVDVDKKIDYNDKENPFKNFDRTPPRNADKEIRKHYANGSIWAKLPDNKGLPCTWAEYLDAQSKPIGINMITVPFPGNIQLPSEGTYPKGISAKNNYGNIVLGEETKRYGATQTNGKDNKLAVIPDYSGCPPANGIAAVLDYHFTNSHGKNICQLNNKYQGYATETCKTDQYGWASLRLRWVKAHCYGDFTPTQQLNLKDKNTLFALAWYTMNIETSTQATLHDMEVALSICKKENPNMKFIT